jgi:hypothetical protein
MIWGALFIYLGEFSALYEAVYHSAVNFTSLEQFQPDCAGSEAVCRVDRGRVQGAERRQAGRLSSIGNAAIAAEQPAEPVQSD